jgi:hypothetical protein
MIQEDIVDFKSGVDIQMKNLENFMMQNKILNNALSGEIEKLEEMIRVQKIQFNNVGVNVEVILQEISSIKGRMDDNDKRYEELLRNMKLEGIGMRKVTTEMINNRLNNTDKLLDTMIRKFGGIEKENAELKEKLTEMHTEIKEIKSKNKSRKIKSSSESDDDHPRKKKSSGSSNSDDENDNLKMKKVTAHEVLNKLR